MIHNLVEEHVQASYESLRPRFPDFCGCEVCRDDAMVYTLNRVPARYVSSLQGSVLTEVSLEKDQSRAAIDVAMMDGTFFLLADILEPVAAGAPAQRLGNGHPGTVPFNVYRARDGWVSICAVTAEEWRHVLSAMGRSDLSSRRLRSNWQLIHGRSSLE